MCGGGGGWKGSSSGSGSNGSDGGGSAGVPPEDETEEQDDEGEQNPCLINETTDLDSTNQDALDDVVDGEILAIEIRGGRPCVIDDEDRIVGSITGDLGEKLMRCIEAGHSYRAEVIDVDSLRCRVRVKNKCLIDSRATLASANSKPLSDISEGEILSVEVRDDSLCVVDDEDRVVGSLAKPWTWVVKDCINSGREYEAEILSINGGACDVQVRNKPDEE